MPTKRKPQKPEWSERAQRSIRAHPKGIKVTLASAGAVVAILAALWPHLPHFQTVEAAEAHEKKDSANHAAVIYGQQRIETLILRNRVNECTAKTRSLKPVENDICNEYRQEYKEAEKRTQYLYEQTQQAGK